MSAHQFNLDDWEKGGIKKGFWSSYGKNWGKVIAGNAVLLLSNIVSFVIALCVVMLLFPMIFPYFLPDSLKEFVIENEMLDAAAATEDVINNIYFTLCMLFSMAMSGMLLIVNGPFYSAVSYFFRNVLTGDDSFKTDIKTGLKDNWKKSLGAMFLSIFVTCVLIFNIGYYANGMEGMVSMAAKSFFSCILAFWCCMQLFVYPLIACVELSFKEVYRNAAIMTVKNFPIAILVFLLQLILFVAIPFVLMFSFGQIGYAITMILYLLFSYGFIGFISMYLTWKAVLKVIRRQEEL